MTSGIKIIFKNQMNVVENSEFPDKELGYVFYTPNGLCWKKNLDQFKLYIKDLEIRRV